MIPVITQDPWLLIVTAVCAYLLGSVPFGLLITRAMGLGNLREIGSGNIGATNVLRTGSKGAALATLILDGAKGAVAVVVAARLLGPDAAQVAALAAFLGHLFPVWLGFRGGKGVATFLGVMLALNWAVGVAVVATWLLSAVMSRTSSIAALIGAASAVAWVFVFGEGRLLALTLVLGVLIYIRHAANLQRIIAGSEPKIGGKSGS